MWITPSIIFFSKEFDYTKNQIGETGDFVDPGFEYQSGSNNDFLTIDQIKEYN